MAKESAAAAQPHGDNDRCDNCGACKTCGAGGRQQFIPYPVYPQPWWNGLPYRPYVSPNTTGRPNFTWGQQTLTSGTSVSGARGNPTNNGGSIQ